MSNHDSTTQLQAILDKVATLTDGASLEQIDSALARGVPKRTLQRRLALLVKQQHLRVQGSRRAARYFLATSSQEGHMDGFAHAFMASTDTTDSTPAITLSAQGQAIELAVRQPQQKRHPVGYSQDFLDSYQPGVTRYLSEDLCEELRHAGQAVTTPEPAGTYARQIFNRLLIDLSWNSCRLEGNTYSLLETERLLSVGEQASGKNTLESQMIINHKGAIEFLVESAQDIRFNRYTLLNLHGLLSDNLLLDPTASGRLRTISVGIGHSVFHPLEGPQRIALCFDQLLSKAEQITDPFEQAFFVMVQLPYLQPFEDVNKRVSRLAANIPFIKNNLCPLSFVDVSQATYISALLGVYELNQIDLLRDVFVWAYKRSCARYSAVRQSLGEPDPFRLRYRLLIAELVSHIVKHNLTKRQAIGYIHNQSLNQVSEPDRLRFVEVVETEAMSLHEGNIARYRLKPSEFLSWENAWNQG